MTWFQVVELLYHLVSAITLPALILFVYEQRRARRNEEQGIYQTLLDQYAGFIMKVVDNADLKLLHDTSAEIELSGEQRERKEALFDILITLFGRAFVLSVERR